MTAEFTGAPMKDLLIKISYPRIWLHGLASAFIGGGASALTADQGLILAERLGLNVVTLNLTEVGVVFLSSGIVSAAMYLKQSPLPPLKSADSQSDQPNS